MASDDSRLQELLNMQNTANVPTSPTPDQPTGQFSGDDIEFESFMFDRGTGPLTPPASMKGTEAPASTQVYPPMPPAPAPMAASAPSLGQGQPASTATYTPARPIQPIQPLQSAATPATPGAFEITGQEVPMPSYLRTAEPQPQQEQQEQQEQSPQPPPTPSTPRGTGPLGSLHSGSNLSARLAQLQAQPQPHQESQTGQEAPSSSSAPRGTGPLSRRGTGPLGGVTSGGYTATQHAPQQPPAPHGPINPAYFKTPTGPLNKPGVESSSPVSIPRISSTGPLNSALLRRTTENVPVAHSPNSQPWQASPTTWSDSALAAIEDFSAVLLAMHATRPSTVSLLSSMSASTPTTYETATDAPPATQDGQNWSAGPLESAYSAPSSASSPPALEEPPVFEPLPAQVAQPGWGEMTGAPPANDYSGAYDQLATPDYAGPEMGYAVPLEETPVTVPQQESSGYAEMQIGTQHPVQHPIQQPEQEAYSEQSRQSEPVSQAAQEDAPTYNSINPDDLQFEGFMFNEGASAATQVGPPLPGMEEFMPPVVAMEAAFEGPTAALSFSTEHGPSTEYAPAETQQYSTEEPAPFDPAMLMGGEPARPVAPPESQAMQAAPEAPETPRAADNTGNTEQGPLPFWLQDTSNLEAIARQGYVNVNTGPGQPVTDAPLAMQSAPPLEAPVFQTRPTQMPELAQMREAVAPEATLPAEVDTYSHTSFDTPAFEPAVPATPADPYAEPESQSLYEDLPPIEPFDFSSLGLAPEEEELGFNTEELTGMMPSRHDPMRATADLDVLADIFDGSPVSSPLEVRPAFLTTAPFTGLPVAETNTEPDVEEDLPAMPGQAPEAPAYTRPSNSSLLTSPIASFLLPSDDDEPEEQAAPATGKEESRASGGWTSMVTTALSMDVPDMYEQQQKASMLAEPAAAGTEAEPDMSLDIEPFDYTQLNLEQEQEVPTGMLDPRKGRRPGAGGTGDLFMPGTGDLVMSGPPAPAPDLVSPWTERAPEVEEIEDEDEASWKGTERDTSLFMSTQPRLNQRGKSSRSTNSTRWLTDDGMPGAASQKAAELEDVAEAVGQQAAVDVPDVPGGEADQDSSVKARVAWADATEPGLPIFATDTNLAASNMTSAVESVAPAPMQQAPGAISRALFASEVDDEFAEAMQQRAALVEPQPQAAVQQEEPALMPAPAPVPSPEPKPARAKAASSKTSARAKASAATPAPSAPVETPPLAQAATPVEVVAPAESAYNYQPMQGYEASAEPAIEMPKVGAVRDIYTSGPLPELEGFDQLRMMVDNNPEDIGAHMALASAYTQLGDPDTALRVYRRVLKKRTVSATILRLITEELNEFEAELEGNARYHQVRGDLYTRQGRNQEAIREYNKIV